MIRLQHTTDYHVIGLGLKSKGSKTEPFDSQETQTSKNPKIFGKLYDSIVQNITNYI